MTRAGWNSVAVLLAAGLLWTVGAARKSLWSDEFHSLHHARAGSWGEFFAVVRSDNHPPLSFALQRISVRRLGEAELALRLPSILAGFGLLVVLAELARRLPGRGPPLVAPWLAVLSSYLFMIVTEARMYAWLALAVLGLVESVLERLEGRGSRWWVGAWIVLGFHSHYYFLHDLFVVGLCTLGAALLWKELRVRSAELLLPACLAGLACLPWAIWGFFPQLFHRLPPGGHYHGFSAWLQSLAHLVFMNSSLGGAFLTYGVALPGALLVGWIALLGTIRLAEGTRTRPLLLFLVGLGLGAPAWGYALSLIFERASYGWPYIAGSAAPLLCLAAAGLSDSTLRWIAAGAASGAMLAVTLLGAVWGGTEDYRSAVELVLASDRPGDGVVAKPLWDLGGPPSPTGWDFYAERLEPDPARRPVEIPTAELFHIREHERVWALTRDEHSPWILDTLRRRFQHETVWHMGTHLQLHLFTTPRAAPVPGQS